MPRFKAPSLIVMCPNKVQTNPHLPKTCANAVYFCEDKANTEQISRGNRSFWDGESFLCKTKSPRWVSFRLFLHLKTNLIRQTPLHLHRNLSHHQAQPRIGSDTAKAAKKKEEMTKTADNRTTTVSFCMRTSCVVVVADRPRLHFFLLQRLI